MAAPTKKFTPEIDSALYEELVLRQARTASLSASFWSRRLVSTCITWFRRSTWSAPR
jgi:hypothetical protein